MATTTTTATRGTTPTPSSSRSTTLNDLPIEIITNVLNFTIQYYDHPFSRQRQRNLLSLVCKSFFFLQSSSHSSSFTTLGRNPLVRLSRSLLSPLSPRLPYITSLTFDLLDPKYGERPGERQVAADLIRSCWITLREVRIWVRGKEGEEYDSPLQLGVPIWEAMRKCTKMETFEVKCKKVGTAITLGGDFTTALTHWPNLRHLHFPRLAVPHCPGDLPPSYPFSPSLSSLSLHLTFTKNHIYLLAHLLSSSPSLTSLSLHLIEIDGFEDTKEAMSDLLDDLVGPLKATLRTLELRVGGGANCCTWEEEGSLDFIGDFMKDNDRLRELSLDLRFVSDTTLQTIFQNPHLHTFSYIVTSTILDSLSDLLKFLEALPPHPPPWKGPRRLILEIDEEDANVWVAMRERTVARLKEWGERVGMEVGRWCGEGVEERRGKWEEEEVKESMIEMEMEEREREGEEEEEEKKENKNEEEEEGKVNGSESESEEEEKESASSGSESEEEEGTGAWHDALEEARESTWHGLMTSWKQGESPVPHE